MVAFASSPATHHVLPDLPVEVSRLQRGLLALVVVLTHVVVAALVIKTSIQPAVVAEPPTISVTLLTQSASGELTPTVPAPAVPVQRVQPAPTAVPKVVEPTVAAVAAPVTQHDFVAPVAVESDSRKAPVETAVTATPAAPSSVASAPAAVVNTGASSTKPVQVSHTAVRYLKKVEPVFPKLSQRLNEYGSVTVSVMVNEHGLPESAKVARTSGYPRLDAAAVDAVMQSRYVPYTLNGVPQAFATDAPFRFDPAAE